MTYKQALAWVHKNCKFAQMDLTQAPTDWEQQSDAMRKALEFQNKPRAKPKPFVPFENKVVKPPLSVKRYDTEFEMTDVGTMGETEPTEPEIVNEEEVQIIPDEYDIEEGKTVGILAAKYILDNDCGNLEPSSSQFHPGIWYSCRYVDMKGKHNESSFHVKNATPEEEQEIFNIISRS